MVDFVMPADERRDRARAVEELAGYLDLFFRLRNARRRTWARLMRLPLPPKSRPPLITRREGLSGRRPFQTAFWAAWRSRAR